MCVCRRIGSLDAYVKAAMEDRLKYLDATIASFATTCPLRAAGGCLQFIHKSFFEYFCARGLLLCAGSATTLQQRTSRTVAALSLPGRRIQAEPEVLFFVADVWQHTFKGSSESEGKNSAVAAIGRARETLFEVIAASSPECDSAAAIAVDAGTHGAAANAATTLCFVGESLSDRRWEGVVLDGADLTRALLYRTCLRDASLTGCRLEKAQLRDVDLSGARLTGVEFGERAPLVGHDSTVASVSLAVSPLSGRLVIASSGDDNTVRLWDAESGASLCKPLVGHGGYVKSVSLAVSPVTKRLVVASGSWDGTVRLWDAESGASLGEPLAGHSSYVTSVSLAVSPLTGRLVVASGSPDKTVRLWDAESGVSLGVPMVGHDGEISSVSLAVSPSTGRLVVASGGDDRTVRLWDVGTGAVQLRDETAVHRPEHVSPDVAVTYTATLRWTSRARGQRLDAYGLMLSQSPDCGLLPHQLALLRHSGWCAES